MYRTPIVPSVLLALLIGGAVTSAGQQRRPDPPGKLVPVAGHKLHLFCQGAGGPAVILTPTMGGFSIDWALVQEALSRKVRVCSWDRAGSAWSDMTAHFGEFDADIDDLLLLLKNAGVPPPYVLAGHAYGTLFVRDVRRLHPDLVAGMVLINSLSEDEGLRIGAESHALSPLLDMSEKNLHESLTASPAATFTPDSPPAPATSLDKLPPGLRTARSWAGDKWEATLAKLTPVQWAAILESSRVTYAALYKSRFGTEFPFDDLPLAVVTAVEDPGAASDGAFARLSKNGKHIVAGRSGSQTPLDQPELVVDAISAVVATAQSRAAR